MHPTDPLGVLNASETGRELIHGLDDPDSTKPARLIPWGRQKIPDDPQDNKVSLSIGLKD